MHKVNQDKRLKTASVSKAPGSFFLMNVLIHLNSFPYLFNTIRIIILIMQY